MTAILTVYRDKILNNAHGGQAGRGAVIEVETCVHQKLRSALRRRPVSAILRVEGPGGQADLGRGGRLRDAISDVHPPNPLVVTRWLPAPATLSAFRARPGRKSAEDAFQLTRPPF